MGPARDYLPGIKDLPYGNLNYYDVELVIRMKDHEMEFFVALPVICRINKKTIAIVLVN